MNLPRITAADLGLDTSWAAQIRRLAIVEDAFQSKSGTAYDSLGRLRSTIVRDSDLSRAVDAAVASVRRGGALGIDFDVVRSRADDIADAYTSLDERQRRAVDDASEAAAHATQTDSDATFDRMAVLGLREFAREHRTAIGILSAYTVGLGYVVCSVGQGDGAGPLTFFNAAASGAGVYGWVVNKLT